MPAGPSTLVPSSPALGGEFRPAMLEAVRRCRAHFRTGLLTNNFVRVDGDGALGAVLGLFDTVVESSVVGVRKPDPRFYLIACERLGVEPAGLSSWTI